MTNITEKRVLSANEIDLVAGGNFASPNVEVSFNVNVPIALVTQINVSAIAKSVYQNNLSLIWAS